MYSTIKTTDFKFDISRVNILRVIKTVRSAIKKSHFYMCVNIPYEFSEDLVGLSVATLDKYLETQGKKIKDIVEMDAKIRYCDDLLDNDLAKIRPLPVQRMRDVIKVFSKSFPEARTVAELFSLELDILNPGLTPEQVKKKILQIIEIRPGDYFLLIKMVIEKFTSDLKGSDYQNSWEFCKEFQRLRDLLDDIMSVEEDEIKGDYNSVVTAKKNGVAYHFIEEIVYDKFLSLKALSQKIKNHPNRSVFHETIDFWEEQYQTLFKTLLVNYYVGLKEFRESYFVIKQL